MSMPISHPWLAPRSPRIAGTDGGTQTREERSPSWCTQPGPVALTDRTWRSDPVSRMLLNASELLAPKSRGVLCRASLRRQSASTEERQPGRERPPLPPPGPGPGPCREGVAHAPAACLVCPDKLVRAHVVDTTRCMVRKWAARSPRTAPRDGCPPRQLLPDRRALCH